MKKGMVRLSLGLVLAVLLWSPVAAQVGPVLNHCLLTWTASPSTDVAIYRVYFATVPGGLGTVVGTVTAPTTTWTCPAGAIADGQKYATVTAVDAASNESPRSNEVPFAFDVTAPAAATNLKVQ